MVTWFLKWNTLEYLWSLSSLCVSHVGSNSLTIKIKSMPPAVEAQVFITGPQGSPPHILVYCTLLLFYTQNSYSESDHFLPHTAPNLIKGISSHLDNCKASDWSPCFLALSQSILREQLGNHLTWSSSPYYSKSSVVPISTQSKCQSPESGLPDPTHLVPNRLTPSSPTCPLPTSCDTDPPAFLWERARHASDSGLLYTLISLPGKSFPQVAAWIVSLISLRGCLRSHHIRKAFPGHFLKWNKLLPTDLCPPYCALAIFVALPHHLLY